MDNNRRSGSAEVRGGRLATRRPGLSRASRGMQLPPAIWASLDPPWARQAALGDLTCPDASGPPVGRERQVLVRTASFVATAALQLLVSFALIVSFPLPALGLFLAVVWGLYLFPVFVSKRMMFCF